MTTRKKKLSLKEKLRRGTATENVPVWVGADMGLVREYEELQEQQTASHIDDDSLAGPSRTAPDPTPRMVEIRELLADHEVMFTVRAVGPKRWNELLEKHPPRMGQDGQPDPRDRAGWNMLTFPPALIQAGTVSVDGEKLDDDDWLVLLGDDESEPTLTGGQIDSLSAAILRLSQWHIDIPFARAASLRSQSSASA